MIALDGALRRLTVCQLTRDRAENGGGLWPRVCSPQGGCLGGNSTPDGILQLEGEGQFLLVLGHMKRTRKTTLYGVVFQKLNGPLLTSIPGARRFRYRMECQAPR